MPWIRLDDGYIYHPKFTALSANAFRLWHEGMAYSRKLLTDGMIPREALRSFRYAKKDAVTELTSSIGANIAPLWEPHDIGYKIHDYLTWNLCKEKELDLRDKSAKRQRDKRSRDSHELSRVTPHVTNGGRHADVRVGTGSSLRSLEREENGDALDLRAGHLLERYSELFCLHRKGAKYHNRMHLDFPKACELVRTWTDDARLEKLAVLVLTTDDDWISRTDRGFGVFAARATWADDALKKWEIENGIAV